jgi:hypothetical protein
MQYLYSVQCWETMIKSIQLMQELIRHFLNTTSPLFVIYMCYL